MIKRILKVFFIWIPVYVIAFFTVPALMTLEAIFALIAELVWYIIKGENFFESDMLFKCSEVYLDWICSKFNKTK